MGRELVENADISEAIAKASSVEQIAQTCSKEEFDAKAVMPRLFRHFQADPHSTLPNKR